MRRLGIQQTSPIPQPVGHPPTPGLETTPAPFLVPAYFHRSPLALYDLTAPLPTSYAQVQWTPFSKYDCDLLEARYQELLGSEYDAPTSDLPKEDENKESDEDEDTRQLLVGIERLHHVNLKTWLMKPVYWTHRHSSANQTAVKRGIWFYGADSLPVEEALADALERGYHEVKPWTMAYEAELEAAGEIGESAEAKLKYNVQDDPHGQYIIYRDQGSAWIGSRTIGSRLVKSLYGSFGKSKRDSFIEVYRGYDFKKVPHTRKARDRSPLPPTSRRRASSQPRSEKLKDIQGEEAADEDIDGIPHPTEVTDLILIIHGIGQKLAETSEGWTFTHAVNKLRLLLHEQIIHKDVTSVIRKDFCPQVLPINWRVKFDPDAPPSSDSDRDDSEMFSLDDITIDSIPAVRDLIGKIVLDIPYYMSHHKPRMIEAVVKEANRIYALWVRNNDYFEKNGGRVHIVCHSLGSAISFDVLSKQPNNVKAAPSFFDSISRKLGGEAALKAHEQANFFNFNTSNLICVGSPAAFFLLLKQKHLVPRRNMKPWEPTSRDEKLTAKIGIYGSLAASNIYNVFYATDPIAYRMNATVDAQLGKGVRPVQIPSNAAPFFSSLKLPFTTPAAPTAPAATDQEKHDEGERPELRQLPSQVELEDHDFSREHVAESRLRLLNDNGTLDYVLPSTGYMEQQYLSMIYSHAGYWESREFARLVVIECGRQPGETILGMRGVKKMSTHENLKKL